MSFTRRSFLNAATGLGAGAAVAAGAGQAAAAGAAPVVDAAQFGIEPNAVHDQADALASALRAAAERGAALFLRPGIYRTSTVNAEHPVALAGAPGQTILRLLGGAPLLRVHNAAAVSLNGLVIDGAQAPRSDAPLVEIGASRNVQIAHCMLTDMPGTALGLKAASGAVHGNVIRNAGGAAIFALDSQALTITGNHVHDCANNGILVWRSAPGEDGTIVTGNRIERIAAGNGGSGQNGNGVNVYRAGGAIVAHNRITDCAFTAVRWNTGRGCHIVGNSCARLGEVALYAEFAFEGAVISDNLVEEAASGISITNFNEGGRLAVCTGNIVRDLFVRAGEVDERGVGISAEADALVQGNVVENAPRYGIALGWGHYLRNVSATGNVVRNAAVGIYVSVTHGAGSALIANNLISGATSGAIVGYDRDRAATGDLAGTGADLPANLTVQGNSVVV